ncbi:MAG TPA: outer membrane protein assembly factor BamE [Gammaproteobacteria bacterium]|nr:outer membrane protein assembly factor BamE [Gammaproteobacteria bacterium]
MTDLANLSRTFLLLTFLLLPQVLLLSACSVHKIDVQQGNVITQEMFEKLKVGMDKKRVLGILGTPLIVDPFHRDRWDYVYIYHAGNSDDEQSARLTLFFTDQRLSKIDVLSPLPKEAEVKKPAQAIRR